MALQHVVQCGAIRIVRGVVSLSTPGVPIEN